MTTDTAKGTHTPGPWTAHDDDGTGTLPCVLSKQPTSYGNFYVAQCNVFADARLIAAAPRMKELLEAILPLAEKLLCGLPHGATLAARALLRELDGGQG